MSFAADILVLVSLDSSADLLAIAGFAGHLDNTHGLCLCRLRLVLHRVHVLGHVLGNLVAGIPEEPGVGMRLVENIGEVLDTQVLGWVHGRCMQVVLAVGSQAGGAVFFC